MMNTAKNINLQIKKPQTLQKTNLTSTIKNSIKSAGTFKDYLDTAMALSGENWNNASNSEKIAGITKVVGAICAMCAA